MDTDQSGTDWLGDRSGLRYHHRYPLGMSSRRHEFLDEEDARRALALLGVEPDTEGAPEDPDERTSGYLGVILAATQAHLQQRRHHASLIWDTYHTAFEHFTGRCPDHIDGHQVDEFHGGER